MSQLQDFEKTKSFIKKENIRLLEVYYQETKKDFGKVVYSEIEWKKFENWKRKRFGLKR